MTALRLLASALCVALLGVGCGAYDSGPDVTKASRPARAPRPTFTLLPARPSESADVAKPDIVIFLPFVNRTAYRIHPTTVRSFDRTLAAFSAVFLDLRPVDPELAASLAHSAGLPPADTVGSDASPTPDALQRVAQQVGAGLAVWGELLPGGRVALHAHALVPGAESAGWSADPIKLEGTRDTAWYDGPRQVISALVRSPRIREQVEMEMRTEPTPEDRAALALAVAEGGSGDLVRMRRAEVSLANLAVAQPRWAAPWLELFSLRIRRMTHDPEARQLAEGPGPARHIAHVLELDDVGRARIEALDWNFIGHERPVSDLETLLARLPENAWERVQLAHEEDSLSREQFHLERVQASSDSDRALLAATAAGNLDEARDAVKKLASEVPQEELRHSLYFLNVFLREAEDRRKWSTEAALHTVRSRLRATEALELLRGACAPLDPAARRTCQAPLVGVLGGLIRDFDEAALDDDAAWDTALTTWRDTMPETPTTSLVTMPDNPLFTENPTFAALWFTNADLVLAANRSLAARDAATQGLSSARRLLLSPARTRLHGGLDQMLQAAYWHAELQARRGQHKEADRYLDALQPFSAFPVSRFWHARVREQNNFKEAAAAAYTELAKQDPYDERWLGRWLDYVDYQEAIAWDDSSTADEARWLGTMVPLTFAVTSKMIQTWRDADRDDLALQAIERFENQRHFPAFALTRDDLYANSGRPLADRLAALEPVRHVRANDLGVTKRLVSLQIWSRRYVDAERSVEPLLARPNTFEYACETLADLTAWQGRPERGGGLIAACAAKAPDAWAAARLWKRYGDGLRHRDRFREALDAYGKAQEKIGGAGWLVDDQGYTYALLGDYETARSKYEWIKEKYGGGKEHNSSGRWSLYWLALRENNPAKAREEILKVVEHSHGNGDSWTRLGKTYLLENRLAEFLELCRGTNGYGPRLARVHYHSELGEFDEALRLLDAVMAEKPKDLGWIERRVELLLEAGMHEEALASAERYLAHDARSSAAEKAAVDALLALGRTDEARRRAEAFAARRGDVYAALSMLAKVARDEGDLARARRIMDRSRQVVSWGDSPWNAEADWLAFEVSLGLPPRGSSDLADLESRVERALARKHLRRALWNTLGEIREHAGDAAGAGEARNQADRLAARLEKPLQVANE